MEKQSEVGVEPEHLSEHFGLATAALVNDAFDAGAERAVLLMRHSARTFDRSIHDLDNHLTEHGRRLCGQFGRALDPTLEVKGYASPPARCMETAQLAIAAHEARGGRGGRTRPVEGLGVFYALDQQKMWKALSAGGGLPDFVLRWFADEIVPDAMMPAALAVEMVLRVLRTKLAAPAPARSLDLCVTHDMTVYLVRHGTGLEPASGPPVEFLDGLLLLQRAGRTYLRSHHGGEALLPG